MDSGQSDRPGKAAIAGRVVDGHGEPLAWANVLITGDSPDHPDIAAVTNRQGEYRLDGLAPGRYSVLANAEGYAMQTRDAEAAPGQVARLDFILGE